MLGRRSCSALRTITRPKWPSSATIPPPSFLAIERLPKTQPQQHSQSQEFHTTANLDKQRQGKIQKVARVRVGYVNVRRTQRVKHARPQPGERKEKRNRVALASPSASAVPLPLLSIEQATNVDAVGSLFYVPTDSTLDKLRNLSAFQRNQMWQYFPKPFTLIRQESVLLGRLLRALAGYKIEDVEGYPSVPDVSVARNFQKTYILDGVGGAGKSVLLLQAMIWALQDKFVVINIPNAQHLSLGNTEYQPIEGSPLYQQPVYLQEMMTRIFNVNKAVLKEKKLKGTHKLLKRTFTAETDTLADLVEYGTSYENALEAWPALLRDLQAAESPPVLFAVDNIDYIMRVSEYRSPDFEPIHSFDLELVKNFLDFFSGRRRFHRGLILASTTSQVHPFPSLDLTLKGRPLPELGNYDRRIPQTLGNTFETIKVRGIDRTGTRAILEFCREAGIWDDSWETSMPLPSAFDSREGKRERDEKVLKEKRTAALMEWYNRKVSLRDADVKAELPAGTNPHTLKIPRILERVVAEKHVLSGGLPGELIKTCLRMT